MYPFYAFHLRGKKGASLELSLPGHHIQDGQFRRSWNARSTLSSEILFRIYHSGRSVESGFLFRETGTARFTRNDIRKDV
jgi:hypothetical protein